MKLWKALVILFCVLLGSGISHAGFLSSDPGLSPGQTLPPGLIIPNPIISNPQLSGLITLVPGSTLWVQGNVQYEPYATIVGPDGSIWNYNGLNNLANLNIAAGGSITFNGVPMGGACPANTFMVALSPTVIPTCAPITNIPGPVTINNPTFTGTVTGPDGSTWNINGINNLKSLNIAAGGALTFNGVPMGGSCPATQFVNAMSPTGLLTCAIPAGGGGGGVIISSTAPVGPALGQLWFDTVGVQTYIFYNDGTSSQWVPVINGGGGSSGGTLPTATGPYLTLQSNAVNAVVWNNSIGIGVAPSAGNGNLTMMADTDVTTTTATANFPDTGIWNDRGLTVYGGANFYSKVNGGFPPQVWVDGVSGGAYLVATPKFGGALQPLFSADGGGVGSPELSSNFWTAQQGDAIIVTYAVQSPTPGLTLVSQTNVTPPYSWTCGAQFGSSGNVVGMCWAFNVSAGGAHFRTSGLGSKGMTYQVYDIPRATAIDLRGTQVCPSAGSACQVTSTAAAASANEVGVIIYSTPTTNSSATPVTNWFDERVTTNPSVPGLNVHGLSTLTVASGSTLTGGWTTYNAVAGNALLMTFSYPVSPNPNDEQWDSNGLSFIPSIGLGTNRAWDQTPGGIIMDATRRYYQPGYTGSTPNNCYWDSTGLHNCAVGGVTSFNSRTGAVTLTLADVTGVGGAPLASPSFTGTMTFPDGSTYTATGHQSMKGLGIGMPVPAPTAGQTIPFAIASAGSTTWTATNLTLNAGVNNQANAWSLINPNLTSGTGLYSAYYADYCDPALGTTCTGPNDFYVSMQANGAGSTIATPLSAVFQTSAPAGMQINNLAGTSPITLYSAGKIILSPSSTQTAQFRAGGLDIRSVGTPGSDPIDIGDNVNAGLRIAMTNNSTGTGAQVGTFLTNDGGSVAGISLVGHGSTFGGPYPPDTAYMNNSGPGGLAFVASAVTAGTSAGIKTFNGGAVLTGQFFTQANRFEGLAVPGYAGMIGNGDSVAGLAIGNNYLTGTGFATLNITGAAYWNNSTGQWVTDGGAGNGVGLFQQAGYTFSFETGPPVGSGVNVTWTRQFAVNPSGSFVTHQFNDGTMPVPNVTNGSLMAGSRDTFGYINASAWPVTITFGRAFPGGINSGCVMNGAAGVPGAIFNTNNQTNTSIQIQCVNYTGAACSPMWFQYVCFGVG